MHDYDDDPFAATRMSLGDHVEELRMRLWRALAGFGVALVLGFFLSPTVLGFIAAPVDAALVKFHQRRVNRLLERLHEGDQQHLRLSDWLNFALLMPLMFGLAFQTPLVMVFLERIGVFGVEDYRRNRRLAIFLLALLASVVTVTPDPLNMLALAVPLWGLYEVGILLCDSSFRAKR